ncbi:putative N-acetylmuramoyl-L-alanine amidase [Selenomonas ruminantium subsp. lactilytica TAM6421]|uniref:Putative N-acetylmuramoyl-L-alanine amidase n=1 Tax=Selenomonas ruminantium subsp. lactilytica (strain NBRC 103574 / TAM6421) TaxID=927704 RepID=I0GSF0_SELRL|nr:N-acetylmuramoyl-L-alanine amidase [Selenomonas ruminantium]BAL83687.1 putative N-acetylmuramoyl-L-alanine amidase [Selenomonas ruminantium subsp. lactilytica TAM6421]
MNNVFRWARWVGVLVALAAFITGLCLPEAAQAAQADEHKLNYFQTSRVKIAGRNALRIEIGMTGGEPRYTVKTHSYLRQELVLELPNTQRGRVKSYIPMTNGLANQVRISEVGNSTQIAVELANPVTRDNYRISTLPAERRLKKPARIVLEIMEPSKDGAFSAGPGIKGKTIVVDAGHGGSDSGAVGPTGVMEKTVTLSVAKKVQNLLTQSGARVVMTRTRDVDVYAPNATGKQELQARCDVANRDSRTALFLSIHCNAFSSPSANGMETYYSAGSRNGQRFATLLNQELAKAGGLFNRGVKTANYYVLRHTNMPASLVELAFVTNYREEKLLRSEAYQNKLAAAIVRGIARYFQ